MNKGDYLTKEILGIPSLKELQGYANYYNLSYDNLIDDIMCLTDSYLKEVKDTEDFINYKDSINL